MSYQALYRKYRPRKFADVVGQEHVTRTLQNALMEGKVAHAYLFSGPRGTGKTTVARILSAAVNCHDLTEGEPCGKCESCKSISKGTWGLIEIDGASNNSVEDIRDLQARIHSVPIHARRQVYIIDEVHQLSTSAFNAFLKTLEEPPEHAMFILATTEPGKLLPTVTSRCQHYPFRRIPPAKITEVLKTILDAEKIPYEDEAVNLIARLADGALRDAESILDQLIAFDKSNVSLGSCRKVLGTVDEDLLFELAEAVLNTDSAGIINTAEGFATAGRDFTLVLKDLTGLFRDSLIGSLDESALKAEGRSEDYIQRAQALKGKFSVDALSKIIASLAKKSGEMRYELEKRILFETCLLELAQRLAKVKSSAKAASNHGQPNKGRASAVATAPSAIQDELPPETGTDMALPDDDLEPKAVKPPLEPDTQTDTAAVPFEKEPLVEEPLIINDLIEEWDKLLIRVSHSSVAKAVIMSHGKPLSFEDEILRIEYSLEETLMGRGLSEPQIKDELERILSRIFDKQVMLEIEMKHPEKKGAQAGLFEGEGNPDVAELKGIIEEQILNKVDSARIRHLGEIEGKNP